MNCATFLKNIKDVRPELHKELLPINLSRSPEVFRRHGFSVMETDDVNESLDKVWIEILKEDTFKEKNLC